jgi:hypothetical protein
VNINDTTQDTHIAKGADVMTDAVPHKNNQHIATKVENDANKDAAPDNQHKRSQATLMADLATASGAELFNDPNGDPFATLASGRTVPLKEGGPGGRWLRQLYFTATGNAPGSQATQDALNLLRARASFESDTHEVHVRVGAGKAGGFYLALGDADHRAVGVTAGGWRIVDDPPIRFREPRGMLELPAPIRGGSLDELRPFLNVESDDDFRLICSWTIAAIMPSGPYPLLDLAGQQGSAKSTTARGLRSLLDPCTAPLRAEPRDPRDLMIAAVNGPCSSSTTCLRCAPSFLTLSVDSPQAAGL